MKKFAIALGIICLIMASVSGQEMNKLQIHGGILTGVRGEFDESGSNVKLNSDEFMDPMSSVGAALKLMGSYTSERWGAVLTLKFADGYSNYVMLGNAYGYINFLNNALTVEAGKIADYGKFDTVGNQYLYFFDQNGVHVVVEPLKGLSFIGGVGMNNQDMYGLNDISAEALKNNLAFGARYSNEFVTIESAFSSGSWYDANAMGYYNVPAVYLQGSYNGTENLKFEIDNLIYDLLNFSENGQLWLTQLAGYQFNKLGTEVLFTETIYMNATTNEFSVEPKVSYALTDTCTPYISCEVAYSDSAVVSPKIGFDFSLMGCANIKAFYMFTTSDTNPSNVVQIDFSWYF